MSVPDNALGRRVQCPRCEYLFRYTGQADITLGRVRARPAMAVPGGATMLASPVAATMTAPMLAQALPVRSPAPALPSAPPVALAEPDVHDLSGYDEEVQTMPVIDLPEVPQALLDQLRLPSEAAEHDLIEVVDESLDLEMFHSAPAATNLPDVTEAEIEALFLAEELDVDQHAAPAAAPISSLIPETLPNLELPPADALHDVDIDPAALDLVEEIDAFEDVEEIQAAEEDHAQAAKTELEIEELAEWDIEIAEPAPSPPVAAAPVLPAPAASEDDAAFEAAMAAEFADIQEISEPVVELDDIEPVAGLAASPPAPLAQPSAPVDVAEPTFDLEEFEVAIADDFPPLATPALPVAPEAVAAHDIDLPDFDIVEFETAPEPVAAEEARPVEPVTMAPALDIEELAEPEMMELIDLDIVEAVPTETPVAAAPVEPATMEPILDLEELAEPELMELGDLDINIEDVAPAELVASPPVLAEAEPLELAELEELDPDLSEAVVADEPVELADLDLADLELDPVAEADLAPLEEIAPPTPAAVPVMADSVKSATASFAPMASPAVPQAQPILASPVGVPRAAPLATAMPIASVPLAGKAPVAGTAFFAAPLAGVALAAVPLAAAPVNAALPVASDTPIAPPTPAAANDDLDIEALFQQALHGDAPPPLAQAAPAEAQLATPVAAEDDLEIAELEEIEELTPLAEASAPVAEDIDLADLFDDDPAAPPVASPAEDDIVDDIEFLFEDDEPKK
jgi:hypothetical protein